MPVLRSQQDIPAIQGEQSTEQGEDPAAFQIPRVDIDDITQDQSGQGKRYDLRGIPAGAAGQEPLGEKKAHIKEHSCMV